MVILPFKETYILCIKMEEYKKCHEYYEISNLGNCRRLLKCGNYREVKGSIQNRGYRYVQLKRQNKRNNLLFHQMVAQVFIGVRPDNMVIDHIDRNKLNNNVSNLRYVTQLENMRNTDRYRNDIKEHDTKKRHLILLQKRRTRDFENKTYECKSCLKLLNVKNKGVFCSKFKYDNHEKSKRHIKRLKFISLMEGMILKSIILIIKELKMR